MNSEPDFIGAVTRQHQRRIDALATVPANMQTQAKMVVETMSTLDLADVCCSDALMAAVQYGDAEIAGRVLLKLVEQFGMRVARRSMDYEVNSIDYSADEAEALAVLTDGIAKRAGASS